eukprot:5968159-Pleurochrysis_carterae.AAC.4
MAVGGMVGWQPEDASAARWEGFSSYYAQLEARREATQGLESFNREAAWASSVEAACAAPATLSRSRGLSATSVVRLPSRCLHGRPARKCAQAERTSSWTVERMDRFWVRRYSSLDSVRIELEEEAGRTVRDSVGDSGRDSGCVSAACARWRVRRLGSARRLVAVLGQLRAGLRTERGDHGVGGAKRR